MMNARKLWRSLAGRICLGLVFIWLIAMIFIFRYAYDYVLDYVNVRNEKQTLEEARQGGEQLSSFTQTIHSYLDYLVDNWNVHRVSKMKLGPVTYNDFQSYEEIRNNLISLRNSQQDFIEDIYIYYNNGIVLGSSMNFYSGDVGRQDIPVLNSEFCRLLESDPLAVYWTGDHTETDFKPYGKYNGFVQTETEKIITAGMSYRDDEKGFSVMINIEASEILRPLESVFYDDYPVYLLDEAFNVITSINIPDDSSAYELPFRVPDLKSSVGSFLTEVDGQAMLATFAGMDTNNWYVIKLVPYTEYLHDASQFSISMLVFIMIIFAVVIVIAMFWVMDCLRPLSKVSMEMKAVGQGRFGTQVSCERTSVEIQQVVESFNEMSKSLALLNDENRLIEETRRRQELKALRAQMNPHFLYNTLDMIKWMAVIRKASNIEKCIVSLAAIMRFIYKGDVEFVTLGAELDCLDHYVTILKYRFGSQVRLIKDVTDSCRDLCVPRFILQPIIENSIQHGRFAGSPMLTISINIREQNEELIIVVTDDGRGIAPDRLEEIRVHLEENEDDRGVGLQNVHRRLRLQFGAGYGLTLESEKGTCVTIRIPANCNRMMKHTKEDLQE